MGGCIEGLHSYDAHRIVVAEVSYVVVYMHVVCFLMTKTNDYVACRLNTVYYGLVDWVSV